MALNEAASKVFLARKQRKMRKSTQSYQIGIQQITFWFTNLICENLCCLRYLRAFDTATFIKRLDSKIHINKIFKIKQTRNTLIHFKRYYKIITPQQQKADQSFSMKKAPKIPPYLTTHK